MRETESTVLPAGPLVEVRGLSKTYVGRWPFVGRAVHAVDDVSFAVDAGEIVALVGASGSGKTTVGRLVVRLVPPTAGEILWRGRNVLQSEPHQPSRQFRHDVQMIFQDPYGALNPARSIQHHLARPLMLSGKTNSTGATPAVAALLEEVGLTEDFARRFPHELSGGQRQRVCIARVLALSPRLIIADEPTSMLDALWRADILGLLAAQARNRGRAVLLITHDLQAARAIAHRVLVMSAGRIVESGPTEVVLNAPRHASTQALLAALTFARRASAK